MIHIVCGLSGNGKTEFAKILKQKLKGIVINTDDVYVRMFPDKKYTETGDFLPGRLEQIYNALGPIAYYLQILYDGNYIFEGNFRYKAQRDHLINQVGKENSNIVFVEVKNEEEIKRRIDERYKNGAPDTFEDYLKIKKVYERPDEAYLIDNSGDIKDLEKEVDRYVKSLNK